MLHQFLNPYGGVLSGYFELKNEEFFMSLKPHITEFSGRGFCYFPDAISILNTVGP